MKKRLVLVFAFLLATVLAVAQQKTYFVSPNGNDQASGLSTATAWKSLDKVNSVVFQPGDKILFESGKTWHGQLRLQGSGEENAPIILSSYGGKERPIINLGENEGAGISLQNQSWWEIDNMEVTSGQPAKLGVGRQGIAATVNVSGEQFRHIVIRNCYVHDIWGQMGGNGEYMGYNSCAIIVRVQRDRMADRTAPQSTIDDILVENNRIERFDKCGIIVWGGKNNVVVRKNYMDNLGGDGIFVNGPYRGLIERNVVHRSCMRSGYLDLPGSEGWWPHTAAIWIQNTEETIMQFNEVYDTGREPKNGDGFAYDFDFNCKRCIAQYNYSKNNHGLMLLMYNIFENVTRYNISENDRTHLVQMQGNITDRNIFYNNIFYVDYGTVDLDFFRGNDKEKAMEPLGATFHNNIFYATGQGRFRTVYSSGDTTEREFDEVSKPNIPAGSIFLHNCYFGPWKNGLPDDPEKLVADPMFVAPGTGGEGLSTLEGYQLQQGSPCINAGMYVALNGGRDFYGNSVEDGHPDFGAFEMVGAGAFADKDKEAEMDRNAETVSRLAWTKWMFPEAITVGNDASQFSIRLSEPIAQSISGTIIWIDPTTSKQISLPLSKLKERNNIVMTVKADKQTLLESSVKVVLEEGRFKEEWTIPFAEATTQPRN